MNKESKLFDRMNYTGCIETSDLMTKEERAQFEKMNKKERQEFLNKVILPRAFRQ